MGKKLTKRAPKRKPVQEVRRQNLKEPSSSQRQASTSRELSRLSGPGRKPSYPDTDSLFNIKIDTRKPIRLSRKEINEKRNAAKEHLDPSPRQEVASTSRGPSRPLANRQLSSCPTDGAKPSSPLQKRKKVLDPTLTKPHDTTDNLLVPKVGTMILRPKSVRPGVVHQSSKATKENEDPTSRKECASTSGGLSRPNDSSELSSPLQERKKFSHPSLIKRVRPGVVHQSSKASKEIMDLSPRQERASTSGGMSNPYDSSELSYPLQVRKKLSHQSMTRRARSGVVHQRSRASTSGGLYRPNDSSELSSPLQERKKLSHPSLTKRVRPGVVHQSSKASKEIMDPSPRQERASTSGGMSHPYDSSELSFPLQVRKKLSHQSMTRRARSGVVHQRSRASTSGGLYRPNDSSELSSPLQERKKLSHPSLTKRVRPGVVHQSSKASKEIMDLSPRQERASTSGGMSHPYDSSELSFPLQVRKKLSHQSMTRRARSGVVHQRSKASTSGGLSRPNDSSELSSPLQERKKFSHPSLTKRVHPGVVHQSSKASKEIMDLSPRQERASTSGGMSHPYDSSELSFPLQVRKKLSHQSMTRRARSGVVHQRSRASTSGGLYRPNDSSELSSPFQERKKLSHQSMTKRARSGVVHQRSKASTSGGLSRPNDSSELSFPLQVRKKLSHPSLTNRVRPGVVHQSCKASKENVDPSPRQERASTSGGMSRPNDSSELSSQLQVRKKLSLQSMTKRARSGVVHQRSKASTSGGLSRPNDSSKLSSPLQKRKKVLETSLTKPPDPTDNLVVPKVGTMFLRPKPVRPGVVHQSSKASKENEYPSSRKERASTSGGLSRPNDSSELSSPLQERKKFSHPSLTKRVRPEVVHQSSKASKEIMDPSPRQERASTSGGLSRPNDSFKLSSPLQKRKKLSHPSLTGVEGYHPHSGKGVYEPPFPKSI